LVVGVSMVIYIYLGVTGTAIKVKMQTTNVAKLGEFILES
jgi:hypothetical protein